MLLKNDGLVQRFKHAPIPAESNLSRRNNRGGPPKRKKNRGRCRNEKGMKQRGEKRKEQVKQEYNNATFHAYSMGLEW